MMMMTMMMTIMMTMMISNTKVTLNIKNTRAVQHHDCPWASLIHQTLISATGKMLVLLLPMASPMEWLFKYLHQAKEKLEDQALDRGKDPGPEKNLRDCGAAPTGVCL